MQCMVTGQAAVATAAAAVATAAATKTTRRTRRCGTPRAVRNDDQFSGARKTSWSQHS